MGLDITSRRWQLRVSAPERLRSIDVATLPYPGIATDYKPLIITMLSVADGVGIVTENLYPGRFRYVEELQRLGADIRTDGHHAVVRGVPRLSGAPVRAHDIRAGAAMVVAGLAAEGETTITGVHHIDRGYDDLVGRLARSAPPSNAAETRPPQTPTGSDRTTNVRSDPARAGCSEGVGALFPVRTRMTPVTSTRQILPSPILPVFAAAAIASTIRSAISVGTTTSTFTLGTKSTVYSDPRNTSVLPRWRPKPRTSVMVMPSIPLLSNATRTSSS